MCNHCDCGQGMAEQCSILGSMPIGFCCENCIGYENRHTCEYYIAYAAKYMSGATNHLKVVSEEKATKTVKEKTLAATPTIDKDR